MLLLQAAQIKGLCYRGLGLVREVLQDFVQASYFFNEVGMICQLKRIYNRALTE